MRQLTGLLLLGVLISFFFTNQAQNVRMMETAVKITVERFAEAGANRDVELLDQILHPEFRVLANRYGGGDEVSILTKADYLQLIEAGKIGGQAVEVSFGAVALFEYSAMAEVSLTRKGSMMKLFLLLVQTGEGDWQITSDMAVMVPR